jgi:hypothetical protein
MLFFDHGGGEAAGGSVLGLLGGKFTPVELQRGALSSSATGLAATKSCPAGQEFDTIDNVCRAAEQKFVTSFVMKSPTSAAISPSVVAPSAPPPDNRFLVAPIPPARDQPVPDQQSLVPALPETGFLDKKLIGPVKVKHALAGGAISLLGIAGILIARSRRD